MSDEVAPKPFPEARPPHLPDALTRQSAWLLFFGGVIAVEIWRLIQGSDPAVYGSDPGAAIQYGLTWIPSLVPPLMGLTLVLRYPDARHRTPLLLFGVVLLSFGELLNAFSSEIAAVLLAIAPPPDDALVITSPAAFAFRVLTLLMTVFGLVYLGAGLTAARVRERTAVERPLAIWFAALAVIGTVLAVATLNEIPAEGGMLLVVQVILGTILSGLVTLAWAYIAVVTISGLIARETPRRAWKLGALAGGVLYVLRVSLPLVGFLPFDPALVPVYWFVAFLSYAGWLVLLAAFVVGLPTPAEAPADTTAAGGPVGPTGDPPAAMQPGSAAG